MILRQLILFCAFFWADFALAEPALIGGKPASAEDFAASVYTEQNDARCSGTLVGPRVLLFAAHCVENQGSVQFKLAGDTYVGNCVHSPDYIRNETADWALCLLSREVQGVEFEVINTDAMFVADGDLIELTGYGCTKAGGGGGNDGVYRIGSAMVISTPGKKNHDIITQGKTALCFGDSGGPAFKYLPGHNSPHGERVLIGVNSRGDIRKTSYLSSVSQPEALDFFRAWAEVYEAKICGIHEDAQGCRKLQYETPSQDICIRQTIFEIPKRYRQCMMTPKIKEKGKK